jgi:sugar lactone lactonase YvrE
MVIFMKKFSLLSIVLLLIIVFTACTQNSNKALSGDNDGMVIVDENKSDKTNDEEINQNKSDEQKEKANNDEPAKDNSTSESGDNDAASVLPSETTVALEKFIDLPDQRAYSLDFYNEGEMFMLCAPTTGSGTLFKVSAKGEKSEICKVDGTFMGPGIHIKSDNDIYITTGTELKKYKSDGTYELVADGFKNAWDVTLDKDNNIYVSDESDECVYRITPEGTKELLIEPEKKLYRRFIQGGIEYNPLNNCLYVVHNSCIYKYSLSEENIMASRELVYESTAVLRLLAIDTKGNIYADSNKAITVIDYDKNIPHIYKADVTSDEFIGMNIGKGEFGENTLYITTSKDIRKFTIE